MRLPAWPWALSLFMPTCEEWLSWLSQDDCQDIHWNFYLTQAMEAQSIMWMHRLLRATSVNWIRGNTHRRYVVAAPCGGEPCSCFSEMTALPDLYMISHLPAWVSLIGLKQLQLVTMFNINSQYSIIFKTSKMTNFPVQHLSLVWRVLVPKTRRDIIISTQGKMCGYKVESRLCWSWKKGKIVEKREKCHIIYDGSKELLSSVTVTHVIYDHLSIGEEVSLSHT